MMYVFLGKNVDQNRELAQMLTKFQLEFELLTYDDIEETILNFCMAHTSDCFELLTDKLQDYRSRSDISYSELCQLILSDIEKHIKFPLVIKDDIVYAGLTNAEARSLLLPKKIRFMLSRQYLSKSYHVMMARKKVG